MDFWSKISGWDLGKYDGTLWIQKIRTWTLPLGRVLMLRNTFFGIFDPPPPPFVTQKNKEFPRILLKTATLPFLERYAIRERSLRIVYQ